MRYFVILFAFLLLASTPAPSGYAVQGLDIFNTSAFDCTNKKEIQETEWINEVGNLRIYNAALWTGASGGTVADIGAIVYRASDKSILFHENWDHYTDPSGLHIDRLNLTPNYMTLQKGDQIKLAYWCQKFMAGVGQAHLIITLWYSK